MHVSFLSFRRPLARLILPLGAASLACALALSGCNDEEEFVGTAAGSSGSSGHAGSSAGQSGGGQGGSAGASGKGGSAGQGGASGQGGSGGSSGKGGSGGKSGSAGSGGDAGQGGNAGTGGDAGQSGQAGSAGAAGNAGQGGDGQSGQGGGGEGGSDAGSAGAAGDGQAGDGQGGDAGSAGAGGSDGGQGGSEAAGQAGSAGSGQEPTFTQVREVILGSCSGFGPMHCHGKPPYEADLDLVSDTVYNNLVNVNASKDPSLLLVKPFDPDASFLFRKYINDLPDDGSLGDPMPKGEAIQWQMPPEENIQLLRGWILAGAKNN